MELKLKRDIGYFLEVLSRLLSCRIKGNKKILFGYRALCRWICQCESKASVVKCLGARSKSCNTMFCEDIGSIITVIIVGLWMIWKEFWLDFRHLLRMQQHPKLWRSVATTAYSVNIYLFLTVRSRIPSCTYLVDKTINSWFTWLKINKI